MISPSAIVSEPAPIRYEQCANGRFAICPKCSRTMANNFEFWICLLGCGYKMPKARADLPLAF